ncbi:MAG TPA: hypothetical protein VN814_24770 [Caulobacteraceae bacterium]|nr:hypothetical protein [Caulobacteraceae bacterium]
MTLGDWLNQILIQDAAFAFAEALPLEPFAGLPPPDAGENAQLAAVERFTAVVDAFCAEPLSDCVAEERPSAAAAEAVSPLDDLPDDGIEPFLAGLVAQLDAVRDEMAAKIEQGAARRLDAIERSLQQMCGYIEASDTALEPLPVAVEATPDTASAEHDHHPGAAVKQLGLEVARVVEVVDARFARIDVEIAQMIDGFAGRIAAFEQRDAALAAGDMLGAPSAASAEIVFGPPRPPAAPADAVLFTPLAFTVAPPLALTVLGEREASDDFDLAIPDDDWAEDLGAWPELVAAAEAPPEPAPVAAEAIDPIAERDGDPSALANSPILPWPGARTDRPSPRRASRLRTALVVVGGGAGLGIAVAACLLVLSGSIGAPLERQVVAANGSAAKPSHLRTRQAPVELMTVTVSPKPAP